MRGQKGITLVALVITIVVLLILAVVAIGAVTNSGLIQKSQDAVTKHEAGVADEEAQLANYVTFVNTYLNK